MSGINISHIDKKFQLLVKQVISLREENQRLSSSVQAGLEKIADQQNKINELQEKIKLLRMTSSSEEDSETEPNFRKEIRSTLNSYIQEIDNCIALLNK